MGAVLELAERAWQGELEGTQVHPGNALLAFEELAPRLGFLSAFSNVAVLATEAGLVREALALGVAELARRLAARQVLLGSDIEAVSTAVREAVRMYLQT